MEDLNICIVLLQMCIFPLCRSRSPYERKAANATRTPSRLESSQCWITRTATEYILVNASHRSPVNEPNRNLKLERHGKKPLAEMSSSCLGTT